MNGQNLMKRMISMRNVLIFMYTILGLVLLGGVCFYFIRSNNTALNRQSISYTSGSASQAVRSIENFCYGFENAASVVYSEPGAAEFYPENDEPTVEEINKMNELTDRLGSAAYLLDYSDCGVIYSNGMVAGAVSDGLRDCFGTDEFGEALKLLDGRDSVWVCFLDNEVPRACYIRRINEGAVFVGAFFTSSLGNVFDKMLANFELGIYVADENGDVIFAPEFSDVAVGDKLPENMVRELDTPGTVVSSSRKSQCMMALDSGWKVYTVIYHADSASSNRKFTMFFLLIIFVSALLVFIAGGAIVSAAYVSGGRRPEISTEDVDELTGLISGYYCEEHISDVIETALVGSTWAFALVKIKDYELIRSRLGDDFADEAMRSLSQLLTTSFENDPVIGINDKSEFIIFCDFSDYDIFKAHDALHEQIKRVCEELDKLTVGGDEEGTKLGIATGVCVYPDDGSTFDELYYAASEALERSMENSSNVCVFYKPQGGTEGRK